MKKKLKSSFYLLLLLVLTESLFAQTGKQIPAAAIPVFKADSLMSGNTKDLLTNFFQLALNNIVGPNKEVNFNSNPFAVMLMGDPSLAIDRNYYKYRALRKLNIGFSVKLDSSYRFNGFSSGIKYAIINQRDTTTSNALFEALINDSLSIERDELGEILRKYMLLAFPDANNSNSPDFEAKKSFNNNIRLLFNGDKNFNELDKSFRELVKKITADSNLVALNYIFETSPNTNLKTVNRQRFQQMKNAIKNNLLWTVGVSDTTYKDQFLLSNLVLTTELSKGLFKAKPGSNLELNIKASCNFLKDTLLSGHNLKRVLFNFEPGVNWVFRNKNNDHSIIEFKLSGEYMHNFTGLYAGEKRELITLNSTLRVRVYEDIWIPLEIKYDPKNGNVFGLFNIRANFTGLGKLLKG